jgi:CheY-like chemotaxis protein
MDAAENNRAMALEPPRSTKEYRAAGARDRRFRTAGTRSAGIPDGAPCRSAAPTLRPAARAGRLTPPWQTAKRLETPAGSGHYRPPAAVEQSCLRVLIADDHELYARTLACVLGEYDWIEIVGFAENGSEAVELVASLEPDVVLIDLRMPIMDGAEATRRIRERSTVPIVLLTSSNVPSDVARARAAGASVFLSKLASPAELIARVHEATRHLGD